MHVCKKGMELFLMFSISHQVEYHYHYYQPQDMHTLLSYNIAGSITAAAATTTSNCQ
jgi:hypothetical protein